MKYGWLLSKNIQKNLVANSQNASNKKILQREYNSVNVVDYLAITENENNELYTGIAQNTIKELEKYKTDEKVVVIGSFNINGALEKYRVVSVNDFLMMLNVKKESGLKYWANVSQDGRKLLHIKKEWFEEN